MRCGDLRLMADINDRTQEGRTGYPLVDACMRELNTTGFMSNRGRQNVASFLTQNLNVDWRLGAAYFEERLIDHDVCSNYANWLLAAGVTEGRRTNVFDILRQSAEYDPQVRRCSLGQRKHQLKAATLLFDFFSAQRICQSRANCPFWTAGAVCSPLAAGA